MNATPYVNDHGKKKQEEEEKEGVIIYESTGNILEMAGEETSLVYFLSADLNMDEGMFSIVSIISVCLWISSPLFFSFCLILLL